MTRSYVAESRFSGDVGCGSFENRGGSGIGTGIDR